MVFNHTSPDGRIRVYKINDDFYIQLVETGEVRRCGPYVDQYPNDYQISHDEQLKRDIDANTSDWIDDYFG